MDRLSRVIPVLLLRGRRLVKTQRFQSPVYVGDPINAVRIFNDKEVDELILLDIEATPAGREIQFEIVREVVSEAFMPVCYGGGVRDVRQLAKLFAIGVEKVAINSAAFDHADLIREASRSYGSQSIVGAFDVKQTLLRGRRLYSHGGRRRRAGSVMAHARRLVDLGAGELLLNSIDRDGLGQGYDLDLVRSVAASVPVPVIACGGAGSLQHLVEGITSAGASAAAAGSLFVFHGKHRAVLISYPARAALLKYFP